MPRPRMKGYEVCIHTCGCGGDRGLYVKPRNGGSCARHARNKSVHSKCSTRCPGYGALSVGAIRYDRTRNLTRKEILRHLSMEDASKELHRLNLQPLTREEKKRIFKINLEGVDMELVKEAAHAENERNMDEEDRKMAEDEDEEMKEDEEGMKIDDLIPGPSILQPPSSRTSSNVSKASLVENHSTLPASGSMALSRNGCRYPLQSSETRLFEILYVPDPSRAMRKTHAESDLAWVTREITEDQYESIKDLKQLVFKIGSSKETVYVLISEWLWFMLQVGKYDDGKAFHVIYMSWEYFRDIIMHPNEKQKEWNNIATMDCVIGGVDYFIEHRSPASKYGLSEAEFKQYEDNLHLMARLVQIWPPVTQARHTGSKWPTLLHLQAIASMGHRYHPHTIRLNEGDEIRADAVLKRSNSECGNNVIFPGQIPQVRSWDYLERNRCGEEFWMAQEYVESLKQIGEWRVFVIGGRIVSIVHTYQVGTTDTYNFTLVESFRTLPEVHERMTGDKKPTNWDQWREYLINPDNGTHVTRESAKKDFEDFVLAVWKSLVLRETREMGGKPSIAIFCRLDIGIRIVDGERPEYFMNEVGRTPTTGLWLRGHFNKTMATMVDTFALLFRQWLCDIRNAYIV